jgi:phospholipase/lecithinase/hemolysin
LIVAVARNFIVPNLPLLGHTPSFNDNASTLTQFNARTEQFNSALEVAIENFEATNPSLSFFRLDVAGLFNEALADPAAFGLTNVTDAAAPSLEPGDGSYDTNQIAHNPNEYIFWDDLHPTATVHAHLAARALALFVIPEPTSLLLLTCGAPLVGTMSRKERSTFVSSGHDWRRH